MKMHVIINKTYFKHNFKKMIRKEKPAYLFKIQPSPNWAGYGVIYFKPSHSTTHGNGGLC